MRVVNEDEDQATPLEQVLGTSSMDPQAERSLPLRMHSQDLDAGGSSDGGSDADTSTGADINDAPVIADVDLGLTPSPQRLQTPMDTPSSAAAPAEAGAQTAPSALTDTQRFCREHGIDPASLPDPAPAADPGVSFQTLLVGDVSPVGASQLKLVSATTEVTAEEGHKSLGVRNLALCGRLKTHGEPTVLMRERAVGLRIVDGAEDQVNVHVFDPGFAALTPAEFAAEAVTRFPAGTAVALIGFEMHIHPDGFGCFIRCGAAEGNAAGRSGVVHRLGSADLPPLRLCQVEHLCGLMRKAGHNAAMVKLSVDGMRKVAGEVDAMLRPLLTGLAVAHLRLGADGIALAYATAASQVVFQRAPPVAACVAAQVLNRLGLKTGACAALYMGNFPEGHELQPLDALAHVGLLEAAGIDPTRRNIDVDAHITHAINAGLTQIAEGLSKTEVKWLEHGLGDVAAVQAAADRAATNHGPKAAMRLKVEADRLFAAGSTTHQPLKNRGKVEEAVTKWRAALWLMLDAQRLEGKTGYNAWAILNGRYLHWSERGGVEPKALRYMDLASLTVMRAEHCNVHGLRTNVYKGRCDLGDWEGALDDALSASLSKLDISL